MFSLSVPAIAALAAAVCRAQIILDHSNLLIDTRLDPIVDPGKVGGHVHAILGGSNFGSEYTPDISHASNCTTAPFVKDNSNYWIPAFYFQWTDGTFSSVPITAMKTYYLNRPGKDTIVPFPPGFSMVGGNSSRRTFDPKSVSNLAGSFHCLGAGSEVEVNNILPNATHKCPDGVRLQFNMPQCFDGRATSSDNSHVSWASQKDNGDCPATHPHHLISLFYEFIYKPTADMVAGTAGDFVLANGDPTGYGMHADFTNGWDQDLLEAMVDQCFNDKPKGQNDGITQCPPLVAAERTHGKCLSSGQQVSEDIGDTTKLEALPGCNPIWDGTGQKPTCSNAAVPAIKDIATGGSIAVAPASNGQTTASAGGSVQTSASMGGASPSAASSNAAGAGSNTASTKAASPSAASSSAAGAGSNTASTEAATQPTPSAMTGSKDTVGNDSDDQDASSTTAAAQAPTSMTGYRVKRPTQACTA